MILPVPSGSQPLQGCFQHSPVLQTDLKSPCPLCHGQLVASFGTELFRLGSSNKILLLDLLEKPDRYVHSPLSRKLLILKGALQLVHGFYSVLRIRFAGAHCMRGKLRLSCIQVACLAREVGN